MSNDLFDLWRRLAGPQPGLFVPSSLRRAPSVHGPHFQVYVRRTDLEPTLGSRGVADELFRLISRCDGEYAVGNFALINNYLLSAGSTTAAVHVPLRNYLSPARHAEIDDYDLRHHVDPPHFRVVFTRLGCLVAIKLLLAARRTWRNAATLRLEDVGEIALLINDILKKDADADADLDEAMLFEFFGNWDITNPADIYQSMSRSDLMIRDHLWTGNETIARLRGSVAVDLDRFEGATLEQHQALSFSLYAVMSDAVRSRGAAMVHEDSVRSSLTFSPEIVRAFFATHGADTETIAHSLGCGEFSREVFGEVIRRDEVLLDMRVLRETPLLKLAEERYLVLDLDYVVEVSTSGLYWHFVAAAQGEAQRSKLSNLWGYVFEDYCGVLIEHFYPSVAGLFHRNVEYGGRTKRVVVDAILNLGSAVVLFEFKSSKLRTESIRSRLAPVASAELNAKYVGDDVRPRGVGQLARDAQAVARGELCVPGGAPDAAIFPVLVTEERLLESFGVNSRLNTSFRSQLSTEFLARVRPLTVMSVEELEFILPHFAAGVTSWPELLSRRFDRERVLPFSVYQTMWEMNREGGRQPCRNRYLDERWEAVFQNMLPLLQDSGLSQR